MKPIVLLFFLLVVIYFIVSSYNTNIQKNVEAFTALSGIENKLTTYDDYGTFNFILQMNDLPYYNPDHYETECEPKDFNQIPSREQTQKLLSCNQRSQSVDENFNIDNFINYQGFKVRRELVPANYTDNLNLADADFDRNQLHLAVKKDRPQASAYPPQPQNIYFNKIQ